MWLDKVVMLNRALFESIIARLSSFISALKPRPKSICTSPEVLHRVLTAETLNKFDEVIIVGDIHGCFDEFMLLIEKMSHNQNGSQIDQKKILKICAGDLINKGPKNQEVLDYMMNNKDTCIAVRGNHDEVIIREYVKHLEKGEVSEKNSWVKHLTTNHFNYLIQLPYTISIPMLKIIVVHAGLVPKLPLEKQDRNNMTNMRNLIESTEGDQTVLKAVASTSQGTEWATLWPGPDHIYFGHDANRKLQEHPFATGLDTGAVYGGTLTAKFVMGPRKGSYLEQKALQMWKDPFQEKKKPDSPSG